MLRRQAVRLFGSGIGGQAISIGLLGLLARISTPEDFGHLALYQSIIGFFLVVGSFRFELAIPAVRGSRAAANLTLAVFGMSVCSGLLVGLSVAVMSAAGVPLPGWAWFVWIGITGVSLTNGGVHLAIRHGAGLPLHIARWGRGSIVLLGATAGLYVIGGPVGLVGGAVLGQSLLNAVLLWTLRDRILESIRRASGRAGAVAALSRYRDYAVLGLPQSILHTIGELLPVFAFAIAGEVATGGAYWLYYRGIMAVAGAGSEAAKQVVFPVLRENVGDMVRVLPEVDSWWKKTVRHGVWFALVAGVLGPAVIESALGAAWSASGVLVGLLAAWAVFNLASSVVVVLVPVLQLHRKYLEYESVTFAARIMSLFVGLWATGPDGALLLFAGTSACCTAMKGAWLLRCASKTSGEGAVLMTQAV